MSQNKSDTREGAEASALRPHPEKMQRAVQVDFSCGCSTPVFTGAMLLTHCDVHRDGRPVRLRMVPADYWVCFHCGQEFASRASAEEHFGPNDEQEARAAACIGTKHPLVVALRARVQSLEVERAAVGAGRSLEDWQPIERDDDIPVETRRELMQCATSNGRISYYYLCDVWRRGKRAGSEAR